jgi:hypothetical protein
MSNVLIGIIGVILFIGLALAGALFLGPRFQEASSNSRAAAYVQSVTQIATALDMRAVTSGEAIGDSQRQLTSTDPLVTEGYLKSMPTNPYAGQPIMLFYDPTAADPQSVVGRRAYFVELFMPGNPQTQTICRAAQKQSNGSNDIPTIRPRERNGCFQDPDGNYRVFARL